MAWQSNSRQLLGLLAKLLSYPEADFRETLAACQPLANALSSEAGQLLATFGEVSSQMTSGQLEESYTLAFDLAASYQPYVGYYLVGEDYRRSSLLLGLLARYRERGFSCSGELPDHLAVLLRFLAYHAEEQEARELTSEALLPALAKMLDTQAGNGSEDEGLTRSGQERSMQPYRLLLAALPSVLQTSWIPCPQAISA
ncbi:MAG: nitrate reductase molybdenum cofactor assembly chaperone [Cyanobacteria bacterium NC_groundwater_1444_Ag_S-0.65um_54_12]|nr:nitrate reductase molybdenum cofactor assembly chaperone [Cyanobacteria bacterium NC_groundwater_1444_Ag_S-0.65um_54_12]